MSYISTLEGQLLFDTEEQFNNARSEIEDWEDNLSFYPPAETEYGNWEIVINKSSYRNLGRNLDSVLEMATAGWVIGTSNDVSWHGAIERADGTSVEVDLEDFASQNQDELSLPDRPNKDDYENEDDWFED